MPNQVKTMLNLPISDMLDLKILINTKNPSEIATKVKKEKLGIVRRRLYAQTREDEEEERGQRKVKQLREKPKKYWDSRLGCNIAGNG